MIDTDFDNETVGAVASSTRWELGASSTTGLAFVSDAGDIRVAMSSTGSCRELNASAPLTAHQRCEVTLLSPSTHGALVIGRRARLWYETTEILPGDRPPDAAATLTSLNDGGWGLIGVSNDTNNVRFSRFVARDMPNAVMPPPAFSVQDASDLGISLSPINATASEVSGTAAYLEWEVTPADPDDFPEAYTDLTPPTTISRVFFARPGYAYDLRVREISVTGVLGSWSAASRVTVTGMKDAPDEDLMPSDEFPDEPADYVMPVSQTADFSAVISDTGRERVQGLYRRPRLTIKLTYQNRQGAVIQRLIDFFAEMRGKRKSFKWTHPTTGRTYAMRFDMDDYTIKYPDYGAAGVIASFDLTLTEVIFGSVTTIAPTITLDGDA